MVCQFSLLSFGEFFPVSPVQIDFSPRRAIVANSHDIIVVYVGKSNSYIVCKFYIVLFGHGLVIVDDWGQFWVHGFIDRRGLILEWWLHSHKPENAGGDKNPGN